MGIASWTSLSFFLFFLKLGSLRVAEGLQKRGSTSWALGAKGWALVACYAKMAVSAWVHIQAQKVAKPKRRESRHIGDHGPLHLADAEEQNAPIYGVVRHNCEK